MVAAAMIPAAPAQMMVIVRMGDSIENSLQKTNQIHQKCHQTLISYDFGYNAWENINYMNILRHNPSALSSAVAPIARVWLGVQDSVARVV